MSQGWALPPELEREMTPAVRAFFEGMRLQWEQERGTLLARISELEDKVDRLEKELKKHERFRHPPKSTEKSSPDSQSTDQANQTTPDPVGVEKPKRRRGGQPGHPKAERALIPSEQCNEVVACKPLACRGCGAALTGDDPQPLRHQVTDIPPIVPTTVEYQRHRLTCSCCGISTCAELPEGVPTGMTGPRLIAIVGLLMGMLRQSKRRVSLCCEQLFNVSVSPGLVVKLQNIVTQSTRPAYEELAKQLPQQACVNVDETPTRERNGNAWIWVIVSTSFTVFAVRLTKASCVIKTLLGEAYRGVITSDRAKMYDFFLRHQWCWAHLKRDFESLAENSNREAAQTGRKLLALTHELFHHWHRIRDGTVKRRTFLKHVRRLYGQVYLALEEGTFCAHSPTVAMCQNLLDRYDNLFEFTKRPKQDVEPTNNAAERALRHAVIWKHLSFGTQSAKGSRFVETLLTVIETCRKHNRNTLQFLTDSVTAHFSGSTAPSLTTTGA